MTVHDLIVKNEDSLSATNKKKAKSPLRKAPQAPKRFKSSYILFFMHVQEKIKAELNGKAPAPAVSKKASELWKALSLKDRQYWANEAVKEKERYMTEKAAYTGPWQVPNKRAKKDPNAPKRNPSAFLLFSQDKRKELKNLNPGMKNTDISILLGKAWRDTPAEKKRSFIEREIEERDKYKVATAEWKRQQETMQKPRNTHVSSPSPVSIDGSDVGSNLHSIILEDIILDDVHDRGDKAYDNDEYSDSSVSQGDYGVNLQSPHTMSCGQHQRHRDIDNYPQQPHQEQRMRRHTRDIYKSELEHCPQRCSMYSKLEQDPSNLIDDSDFDPLPFASDSGSSYLESHARQQQEMNEDNSHHHNDDNRYMEFRVRSKRKVDEITHCGYRYQRRHTSEQSKREDSPYDDFYDIEQHHARFKRNNSNYREIYNQLSYEEDEGNSNDYRYQHQQQTPMHQKIQDNWVAEEVEDMQEKYISPRYGRQTLSPHTESTPY